MTPGQPGAAMMEVLKENDELVFLFSLVKGQGDSSQACHIAAAAGLPRELVERGAEVRRDHSRFFVNTSNGKAPIPPF